MDYKNFTYFHVTHDQYVSAFTLFLVVLVSCLFFAVMDIYQQTENVRVFLYCIVYLSCIKVSAFMVGCTTIITISFPNYWQ